MKYMRLKCSHSSPKQAKHHEMHNFKQLVKGKKKPLISCFARLFSNFTKQEPKHHQQTMKPHRLVSSPSFPLR